METKIIKSLYWDQDFKYYFSNQLENAEIGKIHSIFDKVVNILSEENILYTISNNTTDNAPYTLKVDYDESFNDITNQNEKVLKNDNQILIGKTVIDLSTVNIWNMKDNKIIKFSHDIVKKNIKFFNMLIETMGKDGGCKYYYLKHFLNKDYKASLIERELAKRIEHFYKNLNEDKISKEDITRLIGLGMGLTPSGDDFLTGFLATINLFESNEHLFNQIKNYISLPLKSTTDISSAMIKAALEGKYREYVNQFIYSFLEDDKEKFLKAFKNLLKIGSSSGTDMSVGIVLGFLYTINNKNEMEEY